MLSACPRTGCYLVRIVEDPHAEMFVRCDDVDGIHRWLLHTH
jgi:hypothetical protein